MVDIGKIRKKANEFNCFFSKISKVYPDTRNMVYGGVDPRQALKYTNSILQNIKNYEDSRDEKNLKNIYSIFTQITRGVEGFKDPLLDREFGDLDKGLLDIRTNIEDNVNW